MARTAMTAENLIALFEAKAQAPPPESSLLLAEHLQCKESLAIARALVEATDRYPGDNRQLAVPTDLLPPLA